MTKLKDFINLPYIFDWENVLGVMCDDTAYLRCAVYDNIPYYIDIPKKTSTDLMEVNERRILNHIDRSIK